MDSEGDIRRLLEAWAEHTRLDRKDRILENHDPQALIFDVLPPLKYEGTEAYRRSWDEWQPETEGEFRFDLKELSVLCDDHLACAYGLIDCGGTKTDGTTFEDQVRATFCLEKQDDRWRIVHQHISMPVNVSS